MALERLHKAWRAWGPRLVEPISDVAHVDYTEPGLVAGNAVARCALDWKS